MKFGQEIRQSVEPAWLPFYVDYDHFKAALRNWHGSAAKHQLRDAILRTETFYNRQLTIVIEQAHSCEILFKISPILESQKRSSPLSESSPRDTIDLFRRSLEIFESLEKLYWFGYINCQVIETLLKKADRKNFNFDLKSKNNEDFRTLEFHSQIKCREALSNVDTFLCTFEPVVLTKLSTDVVFPDGSASDPFSDWNRRHDSDDYATKRTLIPELLNGSNPTPSIEAMAWSLQKSSFQENEEILKGFTSAHGPRNNGDSNIKARTTLLHEVVKNLGRQYRKPSHPKLQAYSKTILQKSPGMHKQSLDLISLLLRSGRNKIEDTDETARTALHHAVAYDLFDVCELLLEHARTIESPHVSPIPRLITSEDIAQLSPILLAIFSKNVDVTRLLLRSAFEATPLEERETLSTQLGPLAVAVSEVGSVEMVQLLLDYGIDLSSRNCQGKSALHVAVQRGDMHIVEAICRSSKEALLTIMNTRDETYGRTPAMISCSSGNSTILNILLDAGADLKIVDYRGWSACDYASFKGHLPIAERLYQKYPGTMQVASNSKSTAHGLQAHSVVPTAITPAAKAMSNVLDGHSSVIVLALGNCNTRKQLMTVNIGSELVSGLSQDFPDVQYRLLLQIQDGRDSYEQRFDLPILHDMSKNPLLISTSDPSKVQLGFKLLRIASPISEEDHIVAESYMLLSNMKPLLSPGRDTLSRDYTILVGPFASVTFNFSIVRPFSGSTTVGIKQKHMPSHQFWPRNGATRIVGHRGSGANTAEKSNLQLGENTVQSFVSAGNLGASCVEFDVQLTKDRVPVIFHDFIVPEMGGDIPLDMLNQEQFIDLSKTPSGLVGLSGMAETRYHSRENAIDSKPRKPRSLSFDVYENHHETDVTERMKRTSDFKNTSIKGNLRGYAIHGAFPTLEKLLIEIPNDLAFNVELKYPMLWETEDKDMEPIAFEPNLFVDAILTKIFALAGDRRITFSSFSPEVCILLKAKQSKYPVLFLNKAGMYSTGDSRAQNIQQAIHFAKMWDLEGIVVQTDPLVMSPSLIGYAHSKGLLVGSYGNMNDEPENAVTLAQAGLDAIIVNKVRLISNTLKGHCNVAED